MKSESCSREREPTVLGMKEKLLRDLRSLTLKKPPDDSPPSVEDDFHLKTHDLYFEIISRFPSFAVEHKLELEMWNNLYKVPINALQNALNRRTTNELSSGHPRSIMELKLRCGLLLDRASGVYLNLIYRLLQSIHETAWPKSLLRSVSSMACPNNLFQLNRSGRTTGRYDLDLATFSVLHQFTRTDFVGLNSWWRRSALDDEDKRSKLNQSTATSATAPRILSRGDRLPTVDTANTPSATMTNSEEADAKSTEENSVSDQLPTPTHQQSDSLGQSETTGLFSLCSPNVSAGPPPDHTSSVSYIVQHCLVHLGDVARYRHQSNVAASYYLWAWAVHPDSGHPFNQLAILESAKPSKTRRLEALYYYYVRATTCLYPFPVAKTNLNSILRMNISALHAAAAAQNDSKNSSNLHHLLLFLYAALQLGLDSTRWIHRVREFSNAVLTGTFVHPEDEWIPRLVIIHIHLLDEYLAGLTTNPPDPNPSERNVDLTSKDTVTTLALLQLMVDMIHWFAEDLNHRQIKEETDDYSSAHAAPLSGLMLWFLWLRKQVAAETAPLLNHMFEQCIPALSDSVVRALNSMNTTRHLSTEQTQADPPSPDEPYNGLMTTWEEKESAVDVSAQMWKRLIQLPELIILQGFQPLKIPTQCQLDLHPAIRLRSPLRISSTSTPDEFAAIGTDRPVFFNTMDPSEQYQLRITCLLESARLVSRSFRALITQSSPHAPTEFLVASTSKLNWMNSIPKSVEQRKQVVQPVPVSSTPPSEPQLQLASRNDPVQVAACPVDGAKMPSILSKNEIATNASTNDVHTGDSSQAASTVSSVNSSSLSAAATALPPATSAAQIENNPQVNGVETTATSVNSSTTASTEPECGEPTPPVTSTAASGGLIVNAELAKFIQEQASQVAARQQRAGMHDSISANDLIGTDSLHRSSSTGAFRSNAGKGGQSSRLCLSAAFRRDLPPRFAKRLQAELLEREAMKARQAGADRTESSQSTWAPLSFDQPAPLARKESEAPYALNSLLSVTDRLGPDSLRGPLASMASGIPPPVDAPRDLMSNGPNSVHPMTVPHYMPPPTFTSMFPPPATSVPPFVSNAPPPPLFGPSMNMPSTGSPSDWHSSLHRIASNPDNLRADFMPNYTAPTSMNSVPPRPLDSLGDPFHPFATMGPSSRDELKSNQSGLYFPPPSQSPQTSISHNPYLTESARFSEMSVNSPTYPPLMGLYANPGQQVPFNYANNPGGNSDNGNIVP